MKVFHIISHFDLGGAERVALNICKSRLTGIEYHIVEIVRGNSDFTKEILNEMKMEGIKYHRSFLSSSKMGIILFPIWFCWLYLRYRPTIIHTHTEVPDLSVYLWHFLYPWHKKYVRTIHNTTLWNDWKGIGRKVEHFFASLNCNIAISGSTQRSYINQYGGECPPIIYNGLEKQEQHVFTKLKENKINVLFAGRLEFQKGIDQLIGVVTALKEDPRYFFHIVGNGTMQAKIHENLASLPNVALYDKIYGLSSYLGSFDYLFMPSNFEGLPLLSIEASLAKTPVIMSNCAGLNETLPLDWPLKVNHNSVEEYVQLFKHLSTSSYTRLSNMAYNFASERFSMEQMQYEYEKIYKSR